MIAQAGGGRRVVQYLVLVVIGLFGVAPIAYLAAALDKRRIDILEVPPSLDVEWDVVRENYANVLFDRNFLDFIVNSIIVTGCPWPSPSCSASRRRTPSRATGSVARIAGRRRS